MNEYTLVEINQQPVELCKLLKIANLVGGGGEAKIVISEGYVFLNGEVEYQKRKKVYEHDVVEFNGEVIQVALNPNYVAPTPSPDSAIKKPNKNKKSKAAKTTEIQADAPSKSKRKPISF